MAKRAKKEKVVKSDWAVAEKVQNSLLSHLTDEFNVAKRNNDKINQDFTEYYNMLHAVRDKKPNDWESDIYLPEFLSRLLTQVGNFATQYFSSTDYVEADIDTDDPKDVAEAKAAKSLLNKILNDKENYYYHKIIRNLMFIFTGGYGIIKGGYDQTVVQELAYNKISSDYVTDPMTGEYLAEDGTPYRDPTLQKPLFQQIEEPVYQPRILVDRPTFDVYPTQNVYMSPEYTYSLNDKEYVIFETEKTLDELKADASQMGYFNLNLLDQEAPEGPRGESTYNKDGDKEEQDRPPQKTFVVLERWGKYPVVEKDGKPLPGIDEQGNFIEGAENAECIIHYAKNREGDDPAHIIGFRRSKHSRRPMVRFLCYVDMVNDCGFGDGEVNRELQRAVNDNYNLMNYRTRLAVTPSFKGKRFAGIDENIRIAPDKVLLLENLEDLKEFTIEDNIQGGVVHHNMLASRMDYSMATSPQTMGMTSERAETATAASIVNQRASVRIGMKSMNLEFIGFTEFYDMLLTLVNDFMLPETLEDMIGKDLAMAYNPKRKDKFKPVSQALETEESKQFKLKTWQGILGTVAPIQNPKTPMAVNYILGQMLEILGGSFKHFRKFMFEEDPVTMLLYQLATGSSGKQGSPPAGPPIGPPPQNQGPLPQPGAEQNVRQMAPRQTGGM